MSFRAQLFVAVATGFALGCAKTRPIEPANDPAAPAPSDALSTATPSASAPPTTGTCPPDSKREEYCLAVGASPPKQIPNPKVPLEANGCAATSAVNDACNGVHQVLSGPELRGKECCYVVCKGLVAPCGRLLLDDEGTTIVAEAVANTHWTAEAADLPDAAREEWLNDALLEHASVAAFARFSLELLAIGAPARFVEESHHAALDEIEHARLCFALASSSSLLGAGPLALEGVRVRSNVADVVRAAAEECCCGETFAALVAERALATATHAGARHALARISSDEAKHAELGWRFIAWAIGRFGDVARDAALAGIDAGLERLAATSGGSTNDLAAYGRLSGIVVRALAREASDTLIRPLRDELQRTTMSFIHGTSAGLTAGNPVDHA